MFMDRGIGKVDSAIVCGVKESVIGRLGHVTEHVKESGYGVRMKDIGNGKEGARTVLIGGMVNDGLFHCGGDRRPRRCT